MIISTVNIANHGQYDQTSLLTVAAGRPLTFNSVGPQVGTLVMEANAYVSGRMTVNANIVQAGDTQIDVINGGHLTLTGTESGGGIAISSGTLEFAPSPKFIHQPETASDNCNGMWLALSGATARLKFDNIAGPLLASYNPTLNDLTVSARGAVIGQFHLAAGAAPYSAAEFTVRGDTVQYHVVRGWGY